MNATVLTLIILLSGSAFGAPHTPNIESPTQIGRLSYFSGPKPFQWYLPTAFETDLICSETSPTSTCILRIYNSLNQSEVAQITQKLNNGEKITPLSPLGHTPKVYVREEFKHKLTGLPISETVLKNLTLSENKKVPYASLVFRIDETMKETLEEEYTTVGLGEFTSHIEFEAERVYEYLEVTNFDVIKKLLLQHSQVKMKSKKLRTELMNISAQAKFIASSYEDEEAQQLLASELRQRFFKPQGSQSYSLDQSAVQNLKGGSLVLREATDTGLTYTCTAKIQLRAGARVNIQCQE